MDNEKMTLAEIQRQISSLRDSSAGFASQADADPLWAADVDACNQVTAILEALIDAGCTNDNDAINLLKCRAGAKCVLVGKADARIMELQAEASHLRDEVARLNRENFWLSTGKEK